MILDGYRPGDWKDQSDEDSKLLNVQAAEPTAYICSLPRIKVTPNQIQSNTKSGCPDGWSPFGKSCYKVFTSRLPYEKAYQACTSENANLAAVKTSESNNFVSNLSPGICWVGVYQTIRCV